MDLRMSKHYCSVMSLESHLLKAKWGVVEEKFEEGIEGLEELHRVVGKELTRRSRIVRDEGLVKMVPEVVLVPVCKVADLPQQHLEV